MPDFSYNKPRCFSLPCLSAGDGFATSLEGRILHIYFCLLYEGANCCRGYKNLLQSVHIRGIIVKANLVLDLQKQDFANSNSAPKLLWPLLCYSYGSVFVFFTTNKLHG